MKAIYLDPAIGQYLLAHATQPDELLEALTRESREATYDHAVMQVSPEQGVFLTLIAQICRAVNVVEVGTFTGYSAICLARGLAPGGRLTCFDVSDRWTSIARRYWAKAGLADRIDLILGPAVETLAKFPDDPPVDLAFIDADRLNSTTYYELIMDRLAPGGVILLDNTLWRGAVADPTDDSPATRQVRALNETVMNDPRVTSVMLPLSDGVTMIRKN